jgi:hypothetical protein
LTKNERSKKLNQKKSKENKLRVIKCCNCGCDYMKGDGLAKYCSSSCGDLAMSRLGNARRRSQKEGVDYFRTSDYMSIYDRDGGRCSHCDVVTPMSLRGTYDDCAPELDHIIPLSRGGHHADYNLQILCRKHNLKKGNKIFAQDFDKAKMLWPSSPNVIAAKSSRPTSRNKSGTRGVFFDKASGDWIAQYDRDGKRIRLRYKTESDAIESRKEMENRNASKKKTDIPESFEW